jgi:hypothetical protein
LEALERFRLIIAAQARNDEVELERLASSCPRERYECPEAAVHDRLELAQEFVLALLVELGPLAAKLELLGGVRSAAALFFEQVAEEAAFAASRVHAPTQRDELAEAVSEAAREPGERLLAALAEIEALLATEAAAVAHGFAGFCRDELELEPATVLCAFARPALPQLERLLEQPPEAEAAATYEAGLLGIWRWRLGLQADPPPLEAWQVKR